MTNPFNRPRVFLDIQIGTSPAGRITIELFVDKTPKTCENFRALATASYMPPSASEPLTYKLSPFHRIIGEFMVQGGDITKGDGTGGASIYGGEFEDENIGWREIDREGLVCMANRGKGTNSSQFFITLAASPHLNGKHTIFGHVVAGQHVLDAMAKVPVDKNDRPLEPVLVAHCGELERRGKNPTVASTLAHLKANADADTSTPNSSRDRGRKRRRRSMTDRRSGSDSRSRSRSLAHQHDHHHRHHKTHHQPGRFPPTQTRRHDPGQNQHRRRSDISLDGTLRGRTLTRSPSSPHPATRDPNPHSKTKSSPSRSPPPRKRHHRNRSPSRSRSASRTRVRSASPHLRRQHTRSRSRSRSRSRLRERTAVREGQGQKNGRGRQDYDRDGDRDGGKARARARAGARVEREEEEEDFIRQLEEEREREGGEGRYSGVLPADPEGEDGGEGMRWRRERRGGSDWDRDGEWDRRGRRWVGDGGDGYGSGNVNVHGNRKGRVVRGDGGEGGDGGGGEVKFKGRGSMKYRERKW